MCRAPFPRAVHHGSLLEVGRTPSKRLRGSPSPHASPSLLTEQQRPGRMWGLSQAGGQSSGLEHPAPWSLRVVLRSLEAVLRTPASCMSGRPRGRHCPSRPVHPCLMQERAPQGQALSPAIQRTPPHPKSAPRGRHCPQTTRIPQVSRDT